MIAVTVTGNLGQNAELKVTQGGDSVLSFSVASNEKVKGEKVTTWVRCSMFGKRASSLAPYLTKGTRVAVVGSGSLREYEVKGEKRTSFEVRVNEVDLMGGGERDTPPNVQRVAKHEPYTPTDDELPF